MLLYVSCGVLRGHSRVKDSRRERAVTRWVWYSVALLVVLIS